MTRYADRHRRDSRTGDKRRYSPSPSKETRHPSLDSPTYKRRRRDSLEDHSTRGRSPYRDSQTYEPSGKYSQDQPRSIPYHQNQHQHQNQNQNRQQQPYHRQNYNNNLRNNNNHGNSYQNNNHISRNIGGAPHRYQPHNHNQQRNRYDNQQRPDHYYKPDKDKDGRDQWDNRDRGRYKEVRDSSGSRTRSRSRSQTSSDSYQSGCSGRSRRGEKRDLSRSRSRSRSRSPVEMREKPKAGGMKHVRPPFSSIWPVG